MGGGGYAALDVGQLLEISFEEGHFLLLRTVVVCFDNIIILFSYLIKRYFQFHNLPLNTIENVRYPFAAILKVSHETLLDRLKFNELLGNMIPPRLRLIF